MPSRTQTTTETSWPEDATTRYLTKAAEISGDLELAVEVREADDGFSYICRGCGGAYKNFWESSVRTRAESHAEKCRAMPRPTA